MVFSSRSRVALMTMLFPVLLVGCGKAGDVPEIKGIGVFTQTAEALVEMRKVGTLGMTYGPRLYPEIPDYDIPVVTAVGPMYVNLPEFPLSAVKGIEWHGYRLGGNASPGSSTPSTATPQDWKYVRIVSEQTKTPGLFKIVVGTADPSTGRWKPEIGHEYFGLTVDGGQKGSPVWAVRIK
jgi:hypothetical protein